MIKENTVPGPQLADPSFVRGPCEASNKGGTDVRVGSKASVFGLAWRHPLYPSKPTNPPGRLIVSWVPQADISSVIHLPRCCHLMLR
jgi:hypothetical protein